MKIRYSSRLNSKSHKKQQVNLKAAVLICLALGLVVVLSLCLGAVPLSLQQIWQALINSSDSTNRTIVLGLRLPRTLAAMLVGAALGTSGSLLQGMLRNGLADPFLLGISAGAGLAAIALITSGMFLVWIPIFAWIGAMLTTLLVYALAWTPLGISVERLILGGVAISALFGSVSSILLLFSEERVQAALTWLIGSLNNRGWSEVWTVGPYIMIGLLLSLTLARSLNLLSLGDELAVTLGIRLRRSRLLIGGLAALLTAGAVSISGLIGFVGLIVPHVVRLFVGNNYYAVLPLSAVGGALLMTSADLVARLGAVELPVGAITSLLGAPFFVWLLYRRSSFE